MARLLAALAICLIGVPLAVQAQSPDPYAAGQQQILQQTQARDRATLLNTAASLGQAVYCKVVTLGLGQLTLQTYWEGTSADFPTGLNGAPFADAYMKATRTPIDCSFFSDNPQYVASIRAAVRAAWAINASPGDGD